MSILVLLSVLAACRSPATSTPELAATATAEVATKAPQPTATPEPTTAEQPTAAPDPTATPRAVPTPTAAQQTEGSKPAPTPTRPWQIPQIREEDWVKGGAEAGLVIVEYSDFQ